VQLAMAVTGIKYDEVLDRLEELAESGAVAIEIGWDLFDGDDAAVRAAARRFADSGVRVRSIHAPFGSEGDLAALDQEDWERALARHEDIIRRAHLVGATYLVIHPGRHVDDESLMPSMEGAIRKSLARLVPLAEAEGVVLALENMLPEHVAADTDALLTLVKEANSPFLKVCFDTGHAHVGEGVMPVFEILSSQIVTTHLADNDTWYDAHLQPPYGTIDWGTFLPALVASGFSEPITLEARPWGRSSPRSMIEEVTALINTYCHGASGANGSPALPRLALDDGRSPQALLRCTGCGHFIIETEGGRACGCSDKRG